MPSKADKLSALPLNVQLNMLGIWQCTCELVSSGRLKKQMSVPIHGLMLLWNDYVLFLLKCYLGLC